MYEKIALKLRSLNNEFYQTFASQFSSTRQRLQPGVLRVIETLPPQARILDLGCGNGEFARTLAARGFEGTYLGLDFSPELLEIARQGVAGDPNFGFLQADLGEDGWERPVSSYNASVSGQQSPSSLPPAPSTLHDPSCLHPPLTTILAFATLHHLPGRNLRLQTFRKVRGLLAPGGRFIHSNWQFLNSQRLRKRIQPWSEIGLAEEAVDPGDYLLDWRRGGRGLRYVHHFSEDELKSLAQETGFRVIETFYSDGEGGNLGLYQVWGRCG